jgi:hypothetical protein
MSNLFLVNTDVSAAVIGGAETTRLRLGSAAGAASTVRNKNTVAAPAAAVKVTDGTGAGVDGNSVAWYSDPLAAVTIAGQIVASLWTKESSTSANVAPSIGVYRCDAAGAELATIVDPSINQGGGEMGTTTGGASDVITVTAANVTDTAIGTGERIKVALFIDNAADQGGTGTMGSGASAQFWVNGPTGAAGQSQIAFTETLVGYAGLVGAVFPAVVGIQTTTVRGVPGPF